MDIKPYIRKPMDIVRYILCRYNFDGELVTNLKIQKILYYAYVWYLVLRKKRCFNEKFQAWPIGPVLPSVYKKLKQFGTYPISDKIIGIKDEDDLTKLKEELLGKELINIIDQTYEKYGQMTAFELVTRTHNEFPWKNARRGLKPTEKTENEILDKDIIEYYTRLVNEKK